MKIDIIISADYIRQDIIRDRIVVVIDMLRATSVITTAFMNGCNELIPVLTVEEAFEMKNKNIDKNYILGGERRAMKIEGFDFSNSPLEYTREAVNERNIVLTTTNGTRALTSCDGAERIFIGSMLNAAAVAKKLKEINKDVVIVNAGTNGEFSMDDFICSGFIISELIKLGDSLLLSDIARAALKVYEGNPDIVSYIKEAKHYEVMMGLKLEEDVKYCIKKNVCTIIPEYFDKRIVKICRKR